MRTASIKRNKVTFATMDTPKQLASLLRTLAKHSVRDTVTGCLNWTGGHHSGGYGMVKFRGRKYGAHRLVAFLIHDPTILDGPAYNGKVARHKCDNPKCINPDHIEVGSYKDNAQDMVKRGRCNSRIPLSVYSYLKHLG